MWAMMDDMITKEFLEDIKTKDKLE